ncbi:MAG TPA: aldo/keto reductase [Myxococcota bacterium]|nr:aldo/keto reductase [Myxococcota bacterium]
MKRRRLPGTDLDLSIVGFGCWAIGGDHWGDDVSEARSAAAIHRALDLGVNWFDTAPIYGWGRSEEVLARALGPRVRDVVVATKVGVQRLGDHARSVLTPAHLRADLDATLRRLRVERIDLLQVHWPCEDGTPLEETFGALDELRRAGKLRHLGVCNYNAAALDLITKITPIVSLQTGYSLLRREHEQGTQQACARLGLGVLAYEPLCRGLLTGKHRAPPTFPETDMRSRDDRFRGARFFHAQRLAQDLARVAQKVGVPPAAVAIGWVASRPGVTAVIAGAKGPEQVEQNVQAAEIVDRARVWEVVDRLAATHGGTPR